MKIVKWLFCLLLVLNGFGCANMAWDKANQSGTLESYREFAGKYPNSKFVGQAKNKIERIQWKQAQAENSIKAFEGYLVEYSKGKFVTQANSRIKQLSWQQAVDSDSIESYETYLKKYPNSEHADVAKRNIEKLYLGKIQQDRSVSLCELYLQKYPAGQHVLKVKKILSRLHYEEASKSLPSLKSYIKNSTGSPFADEAKNKVKELEAQFKNLLSSTDELIAEGKNWHSKADYYLRTTGSNRLPIKKELECFRKAIELVEQALQISPDNPKALERMGLTSTYYARQANARMVISQGVFQGAYAEFPEDCITYCNRAVKLSPNDAEVYLYRSLVYQILGIGAKQQQGITGKHTNYLKYNNEFANDYLKALQLGCPDINPKVVELFGTEAESCKYSKTNDKMGFARALIDKGVDVNAKDKYGWTALMVAAYEGYKEIAQRLIDKGANVNAKNKSGFTVLIYAADNGDSEIVQLLIDKGADVNAKDKYGWTALMTAVDKEYSEIAHLLIDKGADVNAKDNDGVTILGLAKKKNRTEIEMLLRRAGAKE